MGISNFGPSGLVFREWMLFVDGENLTIRAQKVAESIGASFAEGPRFRRDCFIWRQAHATVPIFQPENKLVDSALRAYFYTSVVGDSSLVETVRQQIIASGFEAVLFKKDSNQQKAKGVDIALTKDMLSHAFRDNYRVAVLVAGDGDYVPVVEEVKRLGKLVYLCFFAGGCLNQNLRNAADQFFDLTPGLQQGLWGR